MLPGYQDGAHLGRDWRDIISAHLSCPIKTGSGTRLPVNGRGGMQTQALWSLEIKDCGLLLISFTLNGNLTQ